MRLQRIGRRLGILAVAALLQSCYTHRIEENEKVLDERDPVDATITIESRIPGVSVSTRVDGLLVQRSVARGQRGKQFVQDVPGDGEFRLTFAVARTRHVMKRVPHQHTTTRHVGSQWL